jgi:5'-nucleotidase
MRNRLILFVALVTVALAACSSSSGSKSSGGGDSTTTKPPATLQILVTNDDGVGAPGIDVVSQALMQLPNVKVTIVAPATNQSGTGSKTTDPTPPGTPAKTQSGIDATSVAGYPSDSVNYAFDTLKLKPDVVVSGINQGQNLGPATAASGTVGAAKTAAGKGVPAIAASQGLGDPPQYSVGAPYVVAWVQNHRDALLAGKVAAGVVNVNIPTCTSGAVRGVKQVPLSTSSDGVLAPADCTSTLTDVATDIAAFLGGFVSVTQLSATGETVTSSTTFPAVPTTTTSK